MNLHGCIVTFDALHTQVDTISIIAGEENTEERFYITSLGDVTLAAQAAMGKTAF